MKRTGSPERAAQAAAGTAKSGASRRRRRCAAAACAKRRSRRMAIWAAVPAGSPESTGTALPGRRRSRCEEETPGRSPCCPAGPVPRALLRSSRASRRGRRRVSAPHRRRHQDRGGDRAGPVFFADDRHRCRRCAAVGRGEDGERCPGGVGGRVGAADAGRVVGREAGIAEGFGGLSGRPRLLPSAGAGAGAGVSLVPPSPPPLVPQTIATTMKTTARATRAAINIGDAGPVGFRRWLLRADRPDFGFAADSDSGFASAFGVGDCSASASGSTSALIGRFGITWETYRWAAAGGVEFQTG